MASTREGPTSRRRRAGAPWPHVLPPQYELQLFEVAVVALAQEGTACLLPDALPTTSEGML